MSMLVDDTATNSDRSHGWEPGQATVARFLLAGLGEETSRAETALDRGDVVELTEAVEIGTRLLLRLEQLCDRARTGVEAPARDAGTAMLLAAMYATRLRRAGLRGRRLGPAPEAVAV